MTSKSMTGYGNSEFILKNGDSICVEVRSVNHRFLDISVKGPRWTISLEKEIREKKQIQRHLSSRDVEIFQLKKLLDLKLLSL